MDDLISVIVPVYNVEKYLVQCIDSILNQTYKNLEIILVDDESTDHSGKICDQFSSNENRIKVIHKKNMGLGLARNTGLENANGKYVVFVDSDDYLSNSNIKNLVAGIKKNNSDICIGGVTFVDNIGTNKSEEIYGERLYQNGDILNSLFIRMLGNLPNTTDIMKQSVWNNIYSMDIIRKNKLEFVSERKYISEDIIWNFEFLKSTSNAQLINERGYFYRQNNLSLSRHYNPKRFELIKIFYSTLIEKVRFLDNFDEAKLRIQKQFLINLRTCFSQEKNLPYDRIITDVKYMVRDQTVINVVNQYPVKELGFRQRIFVELIRFKKYRILANIIKYI